jgi:prenyltransferase beta subunit
MARLNRQLLKKAMDKGVEWCWRSQNEDGGWGGRADVESIFIDSAEVAAGLLLAGSVGSQRMRKTLNYVTDGLLNLKSSLDDTGRRIWLSYDLPARDYPKGLESPITARSYAWGIRTMIEAGFTSHGALASALRGFSRYRENGKGWKNYLNDSSNIFNTAVVTPALWKLPSQRLHAGEASEWLMNVQNRDGGWGFYEYYKSNPQCTALAILALSSVEDSTQSIRKGLNNLNSQKYGGMWSICPEAEQVSPLVDHVYTHFSTPWAIMALLEGGEEIDSEAVQRGLSYMLALQGRDGGWPFVKSVYWCECEISPYTFATAFASAALRYYLDHLTKTS